MSSGTDLVYMEDDEIPEGCQQRNGKPAPTLEAWFDAGFTVTDRQLTSARRLPLGYEGCNENSMLVSSIDHDVQLWPVRIDLGPVTEGSVSKPRTLYHYTYKAKFDAFVRFFSSPKASKPEAVFRFVWDRLLEDFQEREPVAKPHNPKREPELMLLEPAKFETRKDLVSAVFNGRTVGGLAKNGISWENFADFCIAVRVPARGCVDVPDGVSGDGQNHLIVRLDQQALVGAVDRSRARVKFEKKLDAAVKCQVEVKQQVGCWAMLFGGKKDEEEIENAAAKRQQARAANMSKLEMRVSRERKTYDERTLTLSDRWAKEHYINAHKKRELAIKLAEQEKKVNAILDAAGLVKDEGDGVEVEAWDDGDIVIRPVADDEKKKGLLARIYAFFYDEVYVVLLDRSALQLYDRYKARQVKRKERAKSALVRIKMGRSQDTEAADANEEAL